MQIREPKLEVCLVVLPRQSVHTRRGVPFQLKEREPKEINVDVVEERGEPFLLPVPCCLSYAFQRLGHACPVLCPARGLLVHIPLGPCPSLHQFRSR